MTERPQTMNDMLVAIQAVSSSTVAQFAYQHLTRDRARAVMFTPGAVEPDTARAAETWRKPAADAVVPELAAGAAAWDPMELPGSMESPAQKVVKTLSTGLTVIVIRRPSTAVVAWLGFRGGYADADPPLLVELALRARPDARLASKMHILPGRGATRDLSFDTAEFLPSQLADGLTLLFAKATTPVKEWPTRNGLERLLAPVSATEEVATTEAARAFWRTLFGDHPYARVVSTGDLDKVTHSDVDAWVGRVHTVRNAALVVVGDVDPADVERGAAILSRQLKAPAWLADVPKVPTAVMRPPDNERVVPLVTARPGSLAEIRLGCLLPPLTAADRGHYELLKYAIESRLNAALRIDHGDGYGVNVGYDWLRGGTTYLVATTFVNDQTLARPLAAIRSHWQRWARDGFEPGELNVARWRYAASLPLASANGHAIAYRLLTDWNAEPAALRQEAANPNVAGLRAARVNELFATCKANTVLGLTGNEPLIRRALDQAWPRLANRPRGGGP